MAQTQDIISLLDSIIQRYSAGGEFGKGEEALLARSKTKAMASGQQSLVSAGLAGTTVGAGMGQRWEEEVGMPERLRMEDIRSQRLSEAMAAKAGYLQQKESQEQQLAAQKERTEMGALAQVHAAKYGTTGGGGKKTWEDYFGGGGGEPTAPTAPGGATQHIGQGGAYIGSYEQIGDPDAPGGSRQGKLISSSFQPMTKLEALRQGYDWFGPGGQQILSKSTIAGQKKRTMAETAQKWITPSAGFMPSWQ